MTAQQIIDIINAGDYAAYGLRIDRAGIEPGQRLDNSHQWWQDDPSQWGEECEWNAERGLWDGGELDGVCTVGLPDYDPTKVAVEKALRRLQTYRPLNTTAYLIGGDWGMGGEDIGESIIHNAVCIVSID